MIVLGLIINKNASPAKPSDMDWSSKSVLVIDDFDNYRNIITKMMRSLGVSQVDQASNGETAIRMLAENKYDIILCDYNLGGGKDGQQVLEEGRQRGFINAGMIFIMVTAENMQDMVLGAIEYVPDDYLIKPFTPALLTSRLEKLIRKKEAFSDIHAALEHRDHQKVLDLCDRGIRSHPMSPYDFMRIKAEVLVTTGQYDQARALYKDVVSQRRIGWALMGIGKIHFFLQEYAEARDAFQAVIDSNKMLMEAYDWLAKTYAELDQTREAQETLMAATKLSPKVVDRQKTLGEVAYRNNDLEVAKQSFRSAITIGKNSYFKSPSEYMGLAKVLVDTDAGKDALSIVQDARREFKDNPEAFVQSAALESIVYAKQGDTEKASKAIEEGARYYANAANAISPQASMDLAKAYFSIGATEKAAQLMQNIVKNNHDDERLMKDVQNVFKDANRLNEGTKLISETRQEMVRLNNKGVELLNSGKLDEAISLFETAANSLTNNKIINANAADTLLHCMMVRGRNDAMMEKAQYYLDRVRSIDPHYKRYHTILAMLQHLQEGNKTGPAKPG